MRLNVILAVICSALLAGCASSPAPATRYYLISEPGSQVAGCEAASLGTVTLPGYLQRSHIVVAVDPQELRPAQNHRWSEPLQSGIERTLRRCLDSRGQALNVRIAHLHGSTSGETVLDAAWTAPNSESWQRATHSVNQTESGYTALVESHRALVLQLCRAMCVAAEDGSR